MCVHNVHTSISNIDNVEYGFRLYVSNCSHDIYRASVNFIVNSFGSINIIFNKNFLIVKTLTTDVVLIKRKFTVS